MVPASGHFSWNRAVLLFDGLLTVGVLVALALTDFERLTFLDVVVVLLWLGFAFVHLVGWLVMVFRVGWLKALIERFGLLWIFSVQWFLYVYAVGSLGVGWWVLFG